MIKLALNQDSCELELLAFINFAQDFQAVELKYTKIKSSIDNLSLKDLLEILEAYGLKIASLFSLKNFSLCSNTTYENEIIPQLENMIEFCYRLETNLIVVKPSIIDYDIPKWKVFRRMREKLEEICKIAYKTDIYIGFEFIALPNSSIASFQEARELLKPLEHIENLGYVIDTFHFAKSQGNVKDLYDIRKSLYLVQLSDLRFKSLGNRRELLTLSDKNRLFPGRGDIDFERFINYLRKIGYNRFYSLELSSKDCSNNFYKKFRNQELY